jgi:hypothetical protein
MEALTVNKPELGKLESYQREGLELFISDTGAVFANQSAIARMLGMQQGHLSSVLKSKILPTSKGLEIGYTMKLPSAQGVREQTLYGVGTIIALASRYNSTVSRRFAEMGATMYLYGLAGYNIKPTKPNSVSEPLSEQDSFEKAYEALGKLININRFTEDKPGLKAYLAIAQEPGSSQIHGMMTIEEMADYYGYDMDSKHSRQIGRSMAGFSRTQDGEVVVNVRRKRFKDKKGNHQSYEVAEYSTCYLEPFRTLAEAHQVPKKTA